MSVLRQISRRLPGQLARLECYGAASLVPQAQSISTAQPAGLLSTVHQLASAHHQWAAAASLLQQYLAATAGSSSSSMKHASSLSLHMVRQYSQCDCPTLGGPTPDTVLVEYDDEEVDRFIALADAIEAAFPNVIVEGNPEGPGRPGSFEVKGQAGQLLFSRLSSGGWPEADTLVESLAAAAACDATSSVTAGQQP